MNSLSSDTDKEDSGLGNRPLSELLVDLHVYRIPNEFWVPERRLAKNQATDFSISAGFIRILAELTLQDIRKEIAHQLGYDTLPKDFIFLRSIGRNYAKVRPRQEQHLKAKIFMPPLALEPELYLLENPDIFLQSSLELMQLGIVKEATTGPKQGESRRKSKRLSRERLSTSYSTNTTATTMISRFPTLVRTSSTQCVTPYLRPRAKQQQYRTMKLPKVMGVVSNNYSWNEKEEDIDDEDEGVEEDDLYADEEGLLEEEEEERGNPSSRSSGYADSATTADKTPTTPMHMMLQLPPLMLPNDIISSSPTIAIVQKTDRPNSKTTANKDKNTSAMSIMASDTSIGLPDEKKTKDEDQNQRTPTRATCLHDSELRHSQTEDDVQKKNKELKGKKDDQIKRDDTGKKMQVQTIPMEENSGGFVEEVAFTKEKWMELGGGDANEEAPLATEKRDQENGEKLDKKSRRIPKKKEENVQIDTNNETHTNVTDGKEEIRTERKLTRRKASDALSVPAKKTDIEECKPLLSINQTQEISEDQVTSKNNNDGESKKISKMEKIEMRSEVAKEMNISKKENQEETKETEEEMEIKNMLRRRRVSKKPKIQTRTEDTYSSPSAVRNVTPEILVSEHTAERIREPQRKMDKKRKDKDEKEEEEKKTRQSKESMSVVHEEDEQEETERTSDNNLIINDGETINKVSNDSEVQQDLPSNRQQQTISSLENTQAVTSRIPKKIHPVPTSETKQRHGQSNKVISSRDHNSIMIKETIASIDDVSEPGKNPVSKKFDTSGSSEVHIVDKINKRQKHWKWRSRNQKEVAVDNDEDDDDDSHKTEKSNRNFKRIRRGTKKRDEDSGGGSMDLVNRHHRAKPSIDKRPTKVENVTHTDRRGIVDVHSGQNTKLVSNNSEAPDDIKSTKEMKSNEDKRRVDDDLVNNSNTKRNCPIEESGHPQVAIIQTSPARHRRTPDKPNNPNTSINKKNTVDSESKGQNHVYYPEANEQSSQISNIKSRATTDHMSHPLMPDQINKSTAKHNETTSLNSSASSVKKEITKHADHRTMEQIEAVDKENKHQPEVSSSGNPVHRHLQSEAPQNASNKKKVQERITIDINERIKHISNETKVVHREKVTVAISGTPKRKPRRRLASLEPLELTKKPNDIQRKEAKHLQRRAIMHVDDKRISKETSIKKTIQSEHGKFVQKDKVDDREDVVNIRRKHVHRGMSTVGTDGHPPPRHRVTTKTEALEVQQRRHILLTYSREILPTWLMTSKDRCNFLTYLLVHPEEYNDLTRRQLMGLLRTLRWQRRRARKLEGDYQRYLHYLSENRHGGKYKYIGAEAADMWKRKYLEELRDTHILKEQIRRLRQHLQVLRQQTTMTTTSDGQQINNIMNEPSNEASYKTSATKLIREIEELRREVDTAKVKLATESKLRNQVENEAKLLRTEAVDRKINAALSRTQVPPHPPLAASAWIPPYLFRLAI